MVEPSSTATSKSPLIPIDKCSSETVSGKLGAQTGQRPKGRASGCGEE
jgi:hypothetical protein